MMKTLAKQEILQIIEEIKNDNPYNAVEEYIYMTTYRKTVDKIIDKLNKIL